MLALCLCWPMLALSWPMLALSWALCWPYVGLCWPHVGPSCGLCWGYVRYVRTICWKTSKMQIFPSRTPPQNQKQRKNYGFLLSRTKNMCSSKRAKHRKTRCFCDLTHRKYRKLRWQVSMLASRLKFCAQCFSHGSKELQRGAEDPGCCLPQNCQGRRGAFNGKLLRNVAFWPVENFSEGSRHGSKEPQRSVENPGCCLPWNYH